MARDLLHALASALRNTAELEGTYRLQQVVWNLLSNAVEFTPPPEQERLVKAVAELAVARSYG